MSDTTIFKDKAAFDERVDKKLNGVSVEFAGAIPDWAMQQSDTNEGCWNCLVCKHCTNCSDCSHCLVCSRCSDCSECWDCSRCSDCSDCWDCSRCSDCSNYTNCGDRVGCQNGTRGIANPAAPTPESKGFLVWNADRGEPTKVHPNGDAADKEAQRLAAKHPAKVFNVCEIVTQYQGTVTVSKI